MRKANEQKKKDNFIMLPTVDVLVQLKSGVQIDLEMQVESYEFWENRSIYYASKMYTEQIKEGEDYDKLKKCIQVYFVFPVI